MKNYDDPYVLFIENKHGQIQYFISFQDGKGSVHNIEVSEAVYAQFEAFTRQLRNLKRSDERHLEQFNLSDEKIYLRSAQNGRSVQEEVYNNFLQQDINLAVQQLPEIQHRRFVLYYINELTYEQIAELEGCTKMAIKFSIEHAKQNIEKKLKNYQN